MKDNSDIIRWRVLIIDDEPEAIEVLSNALPHDYKCQVAISGEKALELLNRSTELPDIILLDVVMSGMNGYEVCQILKDNDRYREIPVIYLSALADTKDKVKAFDRGGVDYIVKPFQLEEIRARVDTHLKLHYFQKELEVNNMNLTHLVHDQVKEISESQMATIFALAKLAESRDIDTGNHLSRIQVFCRMLADQISTYPEYADKILPNFVETLQKASPLHDIGKVGIKDAILLKPGRLTGMEFEEMKRHTSIGANTLEEVYKSYPNNYFIELGIEIARSHHEKWDGSGYPSGLQGYDIPLSASIMALADVYDALRSKRVYKEAYSHAETCRLISLQRGKHFNPHLVDVFIDSEKAFESVYSLMVPIS